MITALYLLHVLVATRIQFMDKATLGSSAILGILSVSFFWNLIILTITHPTIENQHIWPLTSEIQCALPVVYTYFSFRYNWCGNLLSKSVQLDNALIEGLAQSSTWVIWFSSFPRISVSSIFRWENGWGMINNSSTTSTHINFNFLLCSFNILIWAIALCAHAACKDFAGLFVVRLILGMCEGSITAGFLIVSSMFYTRNEQTLRVGYWCKLLRSFLRWADDTIGLIVLMNGVGVETCYCILLILIASMQLRLFPALSALGLSTSTQRHLNLGSGK